MNKVYVLCHPHTQTGGAELVHQLVYKLNLLEPGFANAFYKDYDQSGHPTPEAYKKYTGGNYATKVEKGSKDFLILPEINTNLIANYKSNPIMVWWLSVDNFIGSIYKINKKENERINGLPIFQKMAVKILRRLGFIKKFDPFTKKYLFAENVKLHGSQSEFARQFLAGKNLNNTIFLSDYLNSAFTQDKNNEAEKKNNILYNPAKGFEVTKALIEEFPEYNWIALRGFTSEEMENIMKESKIYMDFGNHPGKDRIPREAAINHCVVITNKTGSAGNNIDVPIAEKYKFDDILNHKKAFKTLVDDIFLYF